MNKLKDILKINKIMCYLLACILLTQNVYAATYYPSGSWTNQNVYVQVDQAADAVSSQVKIDSGNYTTYNPSAQQLITTEGTHTVQSYSSDAAGNVSAITTKTINIDKTKPTASTVGAFSNSSSTTAISYTNGTSYVVRVSGVTDTLSGINRVAFPTWTSYNSQDDLKANWTTTCAGIYKGSNVYEYTVNISEHNNENGLYITDIYVYDNAGNYYVAGEVKVTVDRTTPTNPTITLPYSTTYTNSTNVAVTITEPTLPISGVNRVEYMLSGAVSQSWTTYTAPVNIISEGSTTVTARAISNSGNVSAVSNKIINIDRTGATATTVGTDNQVVSTSTFTVFASGVIDNSSGVSEVKFLVYTEANGADDQKWYTAILSGGKWIVTIPISNHGNAYGKYIADCYVTDNASNITKVGSTYVIEDNLPTATILSPVSNTSFNAADKIVFNVKVNDLDNDRMSAALQYYNGTTWIDSSVVTEGLMNNQVVDLSLSNLQWRKLTYNSNTRFRVKVNDGYVDNYSPEILLNKTQSAPQVKINSPANNQYMTSGYLEFDISAYDADNELYPTILDNSEFNTIGNGTINCNDGEYSYDYSQNVDWSYHGMDFIADTSKTYTLSFEAYISDDANISDTGNTFIMNMEQGITSSFYYDNTKKGTWQVFTYTATPTSANVRVNIYPTTGSIPATQGILKFRNVSFSENSLNTKVYTDTENVLNNGVFLDTTSGNERIQFISYTYLPVGNHNIYLSAEDSQGNITLTSCTIKVPEEISLYTGNNNKTFYISNFDISKNQVYYNRLNSKITNDIYFLNVLGSNANINKNYISGITGIQNVTGQNQYMQKNLVEGDGTTVIGVFNGKTGTNTITGNVILPTTLESIKAIILDTSNTSYIASDILSLNINTSYTLEFDYWSDTDNTSFYTALSPSIFREDLTASPNVQHYIKTISSADVNMYNLALAFGKDLDVPGTGKIYISNVTLYRSDENRSKIYTTDGIKVNSIVNWIMKALGASNSFSKCIEVGSKISIQNIIFKDSEGDYVSTNPNRGLNRRFQIVHIPGYYNNPDNSISNNGVWYLDSGFTSFDGNPVERDGENATIQFNKAGKYILNVQEDDRVSNSSGIDFSKSSNLSNYVIYVHRPPVAVINYNAIDNETVQLFSQSYDLDFYKRADKGISSVKWEYRIVDYSDNVIQDWQTVPDINNFKLNVLYKTYVRLTVTDYGATIESSNDNELSNSTIKIFDNIGQPPVADFDLKVGTTLENSVPSYGIAYRGTQLTNGEILAETVQYDDSFIQWNDFFATSGSRSESWSVSQDVFNWRVRTQMSADTTLTVINKFNLSDQKNKSVDVKRVDLTNGLDSDSDGVNDSPFNAETTQHFTFSMISQEGELNWSDLSVKLSSDDMKFYDVTLENTSSNIFEGNIDIPYTDNDICTYKASIYSNRTGELLQTTTYSVEVINLKFVSLYLSGYWNHWRGQVDLMGNTLSDDPHRFLSLEKIKLDIQCTGDPDYVEIDMSPELKAMTYTDPNGNVYNYTDFFDSNVSFPAQVPVTGNTVSWEYCLPLASSTIDWKNNVIGSPYYMTVTLVKGSRRVTYVAPAGASEWQKLDNINITGNIYDLTYTQPNSN